MIYADRSTIVAFAAALDGLSASPSDPVGRAAYLWLVAPGESPSRADGMATMSGCALVARAVLRHFIDHPLLEQPYRTAQAMADLVAIAREADALHGPERVPEPGDLVVVGGGTDGGGPEHVWICLAPTGDGRLDGIDGGQRGRDGSQLVKMRQHELADGYDRAFDDGAGGSARRKVRFVIDTEKVIERFGRG